MGKQSEWYEGTFGELVPSPLLHFRLRQMLCGLSCTSSPPFTPVALLQVQAYLFGKGKQVVQPRRRRCCGASWHAAVALPHWSSSAAAAAAWRNARKPWAFCRCWPQTRRKCAAGTLDELLSAQVARHNSKGQAMM